MKKHLFIFLIFAILTVAMTFPLVFKINSHIPGFQFTDEPYGSIWQFWMLNYSFHNHLPILHTTLIGYPSGVDLFSTGYSPYIYVFLMSILSIATSPLIAYNLILLFNIFLSGIVVYMLVFYLTKNIFSGVFSGVAFAFCPYQFARLWQHPTLTLNEWIPLCLLSAILLKDKFSKATAVLFLCSILILFSFDLHIMLFGFYVFIIFMVYLILFNWRTKLFKKPSLFKEDIKYFKRVVVILLLAFVILLPQYFPFIKNALRFSASSIASGFNPYRRPFEDLFSQSAKPLSYFLPSAQHPIFGKFTEYFVGDFLYGVSFTEHALYLGWTTIIFAFLAFRFWRRRNKNSSNQEEKFFIGYFLLLVIVSWLFSQPPWWKFGSIKIYLPSFFIYKVLPMIRAYARFGLLVMLAVSVLAGFGLKIVLKKFKTNLSKILATCLFSGLLLFEFLNFPPFKVIDLTVHPQIYDWLKNEPKDYIIAEYPLDANGQNEMYKFHQTIHQKKIINATIPGTRANELAQLIDKLSMPDTAGILKWMGVKYVLVHTNPYKETNLLSEKVELDKIRRNKGLKFIKNLDDIEVYEVVATPVKPVITEGGAK
ncbi:MAG: hypothetical protein PHI86_01825 [Candidatus Omnitrophica bacterium]|nr:hypothetical protein [Candidatus Omnitrophota bacterium]HOX55134.1 hypothetical protein [Candidatus Omnitrophota bacterium]